MILFQSRFLIGNIWVAIEHIGSVGTGFILFNVPGVLKFGSVVGKYYRKVLLKGPDSDSITKIVDCIDNASLSAVGKQNDNHETTTSK